MHLSTTLRHSTAIRAVIETMRRNPCAPLELDRMARIASMSRFHFLRVFEEGTGVSPVRFLAALRMERAKKLLLETSMQVTSIGFEVGYQSLGTFTRLFTHLVGVNPRELRRLRDELAGKSPQELIAGYLVRPYPPAPTTVVSGSIHAPKDFNGVIFVGLFPSRIPQGRPSSGELLFNQGRFELRWDATHRVGHVLAAAFPLASDVLQYLLPPQECVLVTSSVLVRKAPSAAVSPPDLSLRRLSPLDPPILIALPVLLRS